MGDAKTYPQLGCYDGGNSEQKRSTDVLAEVSISLCHI